MVMVKAFDLSSLGTTEQLETHVLLGGPAHGQYREIKEGENKLMLMISPVPNSVPEPVTYMRRTIQAQTPNGRFERTLFVEQSIPVDVAGDLLEALLLQNFAQQLLAQWIEGGIPRGIDND